jgi:ABC-type ATPase involved in cell division
MQTLLAVFDGFLAHGSTVVVVEHDRDLIAQRRPRRRRQARLRRASIAPDQ